jgi:hypothetical protein
LLLLVRFVVARHRVSPRVSHSMLLFANGPLIYVSNPIYECLWSRLFFVLLAPPVLVPILVAILGGVAQHAQVCLPFWTFDQNARCLWLSTANGPTTNVSNVLVDARLDGHFDGIGERLLCVHFPPSPVVVATPVLFVPHVQSLPTTSPLDCCVLIFALVTEVHPIKCVSNGLADVLCLFVHRWFVASSLSTVVFHVRLPPLVIAGLALDWNQAKGVVVGLGTAVVVVVVVAAAAAAVVVVGSIVDVAPEVVVGTVVRVAGTVVVVGVVVVGTVVVGIVVVVVVDTVVVVVMGTVVAKEVGKILGAVGIVEVGTVGTVGTVEVGTVEVVENTAKVHFVGTVAGEAVGTIGTVDVVGGVAEVTRSSVVDYLNA